MLKDKNGNPRTDLSAPYALTLYKDKIVCHQCWSKSALGEEVSAWLQVTFTAVYSIDNSGWLANVNVSKPPAPQMDAARTLRRAITAEHKKMFERDSIFTVGQFRAINELAAERLAHLL